FQVSMRSLSSSFFFIHPAPTGIYTLSLHDALPILHAVSAQLRRLPALARGHRERAVRHCAPAPAGAARARRRRSARAFAVLEPLDRKSTRLNSSHVKISYAVFCLKKKKKTDNTNES